MHDLQRQLMTLLILPNKKQHGGEQDGGEVGGHRVHLSLGYIRNTPLDTEVHAEH